MIYNIVRIPTSTPQKLSCRARHLHLCVPVLCLVLSVYVLADTISRISLGSHLSEACQVSHHPAPTKHTPDIPPLGSQLPVVAPRIRGIAQSREMCSVRDKLSLHCKTLQ